MKKVKVKKIDWKKKHHEMFCWVCFSFLFSGILFILLLSAFSKRDKEIDFANKRLNDLVKSRMCTNCYSKELIKKNIEFLFEEDDYDIKVKK